MADRKGRSVIFRTPVNCSLKDIKDAISVEIGPDQITVLQQLSNGEYLVELSENKLAEDLIESGFSIEELHAVCNPPRGYYMNVSIMGLRAYVDNEAVIKALQPYGEIKGDVIRLRYKADHDLAGLENGNRLVKMILSKPSIPYSLKIADEWCRIIHNNQQPICRECNELGHSRRKCPQIICRLCEAPGHMSQDCPSRLTFPPRPDTAIPLDNSTSVMEQDTPTDSVPPASENLLTSEPKENTSASASTAPLDTAPSADPLPPPTSDSNATPMDETKSLKRPHVSDSDSDSARPKQPPRRPKIQPKPNVVNSRHKQKETTTSTNTS